MWPLLATCGGRERVAHDGPRGGVGRADLLAVLEPTRLGVLERPLDERGDVEEAAAPGQERGDRLLVRGVQRGGQQPSRLPRAPGERQAAEGVEVRGLEGERELPREVESRGGRERAPPRPGQRV